MTEFAIGDGPVSIVAPFCATPISVRLSAADRALIDQAAELAEVSLSDIVRHGAVRLAQRLLLLAREEDPEVRSLGIQALDKAGSLSRYRYRRAALRQCADHGCKRQRAPQRKRCAECLERRRAEQAARRAKKT